MVVTLCTLCGPFPHIMKGVEWYATLAVEEEVVAREKDN